MIGSVPFEFTSNRMAKQTTQETIQLLQHQIHTAMKIILRV